MSLGISKSTSDRLYNGLWHEFQQSDPDAWTPPPIDFNKQPRKAYTPIFTPEYKVSGDRVTVEDDTGLVFRVTRVFKRPMLAGSMSRDNHAGYIGFMRPKEKGIPRNLSMHIKHYMLDIGYKDPEAVIYDIDGADLEQEILWGDAMPDIAKARIRVATDHDDLFTWKKKTEENGYTGLYCDGIRALNKFARQATETMDLPSYDYSRSEPSVTYTLLPYFKALKDESDRIIGIQRDFIFDNGFGWNVKILFDDIRQNSPQGGLFDDHVGQRKSSMTDKEFRKHISDKTLLDSAHIKHKIVISPLTITREYLDIPEPPLHDFSFDELAPLEDDPEAFINEWGELITFDEGVILKEGAALDDENLSRLSGVFEKATEIPFLGLKDVEQGPSDIKTLNRILAITKNIPDGPQGKEDFFQIMLDVNKISDPEANRPTPRAGVPNYQAKLERKRGKLEPGNIPELKKWWPMGPMPKRQPVVHLSTQVPGPSDQPAQDYA